MATFMYIEKSVKNFHFQAYFMFIKYFKCECTFINEYFF